ncbi:type I-Fv CRISPR-associated protein Cas7fv [Pseudoalteromonas gelatinilytica]|uniref:type I-Fv CRISPR-associated protein Cas7fv n=1 Tax=Pseudoalteromonas gelatinilytica TaxID=1703256 RepID=UPI0007C5AE96|nr:type I-Fv CRISPR-associated protein Cas7fv [Pseudoalteromonas gelatinilytica]
MEKVTGIKSVDFKIVALGHGVVNWNGPTTLTGDDGKTVDNHTLPKLRGYSNLTGRIKQETGYKYKKQATDIDFKETPLYISQNCIRHHLFRSQAFDIHYANKAKLDNLTKVLSSVTGLVRGYVVPNSQNKRTSPLLIEDFVDQLGNGNFEQFGQAGERDNSSFFSKTTFGDTKYISYGSISIEQLQFISLDKKFDREAMQIKEGQGEEVAKSVEEFIQKLDPELSPKAIFHTNYVRRGTIFDEGENGILLNQDAIKALVQFTVNLIAELSIRQAKSYMYVDEMVIDYNDSNKMMRIKRDESEISSKPQTDFAIYFEAK